MIAADELHPHVVQICSGLVGGVAYLRSLLIAHCDIKPVNIVISPDFCPGIIDFDYAICLENEDKKVDGSRGTKGWMAPEVSDSTAYNPLRADR
ncbi:kinase-like domain-containing protein [Cytidiella melzeri]|nr:kinase-like domain-containing protein [Cytidiella melzeri]